MKKNTKSKTRILLTGGSGYLGRAIVNELTMPGPLLNVDEIRVFDIKPFPERTKRPLTFVKGNICNYEEVLGACDNIDLVIHSAAIVDWGTRPDREIHAVNVSGTENIILACREKQIKNLILTGSLDAVFGGKPLVNIDETIPYPEKHSTYYCKSKYLAEKQVLSANSRTLRTCVLRPADVYGEGDPYHLGPLLDMAKSGFYVRLGNGRAKCQHVYVGNIAHAHILAAKALINNNEKVFGRAYFITDGPGSNFFSFFDSIILEAGYSIRPKNLWLPRWLAYTIGTISEIAALLLRPVKYYRPKMSRFAVTYTCTDFTFSAERAMQDFGFLPKYPAREAFKRTVSHYRTEKEKYLN